MPQNAACFFFPKLVPCRKVKLHLISLLPTWQSAMVVRDEIMIHHIWRTPAWATFVLFSACIISLWHKEHRKYPMTVFLCPLSSGMHTNCHQLSPKTSKLTLSKSSMDFQLKGKENRFGETSGRKSSTWICASLFLD